METSVFFSEGEQNTSKSSFEIEMKVSKVLSEGQISKMASDIGSTSEITPLTDLLDFTVTITDPDKFGKIHKMSFVVPEGSTDVKYMKLDQKNR